MAKSKKPRKHRSASRLSHEDRYLGAFSASLWASAIAAVVLTWFGFGALAAVCAAVSVVSLALGLGFSLRGSL
jgi:hypothetical protein